MTCTDFRLLAERRAAGFPLKARQERALERHLAECSACAAVARFENGLAAAVREFPAVAPPADFADMVLAQLPDPVTVPEPSFREYWWNLALGVLAAGAASWALWEKAPSWIPWLTGAKEKTEIADVLFNAYMSMGEVSLPTMSVVFLALIGLTAWGASALAAGER
ncbi:MAG TPA: hypothetical protein P5569_13375 [Candidatus Latescibacteria bacterium]|nr:hypothetical protein [Candidatus Latescibacterota bacterium]